MTREWGIKGKEGKGKEEPPGQIQKYKVKESKDKYWRGITLEWGGKESRK